jgi:hypothetical protein
MRPTHGPDSSKARASVFERHATKARILLVLLPVLVLDCAAARLLGSPRADDFRSRHPYYHHGLIAGRESVSAWGEGDPYPVFTNSLGMFDRSARVVARESDRHRIVFIGDSYTEGLGVPYEETFVGRIGERVDPERVEILNAGVMSYCPKLYYLRTRHLIEQQRLDFDELYVFIDISDIQDEILYDEFVPTEGDGRPGPAARARGFLERSSFVYRSLDALVRYRELQRRMERYNAQVYPPWLNYFWHDEVNEEAYADPDFPMIRAHWTLSPRLFRSEWTQRGIRSAREYMEKLVALCRDHGIRVTIAVYPWTVQVERRNLKSVQVRLWRAFAEEHDVGFIDLFPSLITALSYPDFAARYILPGDAHWNAAGHGLVADAVWPHVEQGLREAHATGDTRLRPDP